MEGYNPKQHTTPFSRDSWFFAAKVLHRSLVLRKAGPRISGLAVVGFYES